MGVRILNDELATKATKELGEDPQRLNDGINSFKEWIAKQPHLANNVRTDDQWLAAFLRGCKFRIEIAKEKFDAFYTLRTMLPELHKNMDPFSPTLQKQLSIGSLVILPKIQSADSPRVMFSRTGLHHPDDFTPEENATYNHMIFLHLLLNDDNATVSGVHFVIDVKDTSVDVVKYLTAQNLKKVRVVSEKALPFRYKSVHYVNVPPGAEALFTFLKTFMNEKAKSRLYVHSSLEAVFEFLPKSIFPKEYGGDAYTMQEIVDDTKKKVESLHDLYQEESMYNSNEKLRLGKSVCSESLFGTDGNFRKLNFD